MLYVEVGGGGILMVERWRGSMGWFVEVEERAVARVLRL
jgi:hypothetical protein